MGILLNGLFLPNNNPLPFVLALGLALVLPVAIPLTNLNFVIPHSATFTLHSISAIFSFNILFSSRNTIRLFPSVSHNNSSIYIFIKNKIFQ